MSTSNEFLSVLIDDKNGLFEDEDEQAIKLFIRSIIFASGLTCVDGNNMTHSSTKFTGDEYNVRYTVKYKYNQQTFPNINSGGHLLEVYLTSWSSSNDENFQDDDFWRVACKWVIIFENTIVSETFVNSQCLYKIKWNGGKPTVVGSVKCDSLPAVRYFETDASDAEVRVTAIGKDEEASVTALVLGSNKTCEEEQEVVRGWSTDN